MRTLYLDPASNVTGYAVMDERGRVVDGGLLKAAAKLPPVLRAKAMAADAWELAGEHQVKRIVMEIPGGHVHSRMGGVGHGLSVYGMAAGVIWACLHLWGAGRSIEVEAVTVDEWTRGKGTKAARARRTLAAHPELNGKVDGDKGLDVLDAVGLGDWWMRERV